MGKEQDPMWDHNVNETAKAMYGAIKTVMKSLNMSNVIIGKAADVTDTLCNIDRSEENAPTIPGARLNALEAATGTYATTVPKAGSWVLAAIIEGDQTEAVIIACSEIEKVIWKCGANTTYLFTDGTIEMKVGDRSIKITAAEILMNGGTNGGIPIVQKVNDNLEAIKTYLEDMASAISTGISAVGIGSAASGTVGAEAFDGAMELISLEYENIENPLVKH